MCVPKQIVWGQKYEPIARRAYVVGYMRSHGHTNLSASDCGFCVHSEKGWLGASPDARVYDPDSNVPNGMNLSVHFPKQMCAC